MRSVKWIGCVLLLIAPVLWAQQGTVIIRGGTGGTQATVTGGKLDVNATFSGTVSGNAAASATGSAVPAAADYQGVNVGGTLRGATRLALGRHFSQTIAVVDASGNQITSFGTSGAIGAAVPGSGAYTAVNVGGTLTGVTGTGTSMNVNCTGGCAGGTTDADDG